MQCSNVILFAYLDNLLLTRTHHVQQLKRYNEVFVHPSFNYQPYNKKSLLLLAIVIIKIKN